MHIDMDAYFASVEEVCNPGIKGRPILVSGHPGARGVVASCSYAAKEFGVCSGMSLAEALSLCPQALTVKASHDLYASFSQKIFSIISSFAPDIEVCSIDEAYIRAEDVADCHGGPELLAHKIKDAVFEGTGLRCSVGVAPNKLIAKISSDMAKPNGLKIVSPAQVASFMQPLPVKNIPGVGSSLSAKLSDWGIETCGDIMKTGPGFFSQKMGKRGAELYQRACGIDETPVITEPRAAKSISSSITLVKDTCSLERIETIIRFLADNVAARMRHERKNASVISVSLRYSDFRNITRSSKTGMLSGDGKIISGVARELFLKTRQCGEEVRMLGVSAEGLSDVDRDPLFREDAKRENLLRQIDRINDRFGEGTVIPSIFLDDEERKRKRK